MKNNSNKYIEDAIRQKIGKEDKLVDAIMEALSIGKESAYRRMRGEVPYTFDDAMKIARKHNISLDSILGNQKNGATIVNANIIDCEDPISSYKSYLGAMIELLKDLRKRKDPIVYLALDSIPFSFFMSCYNLCKFRLYKWMHQMNNVGYQQAFCDVEFPEDVWKMHTETVREFFSLPDINFILDKKLFQTQVKEILLYVQLGLIDKESLALLKTELLKLLVDIEEMTIAKSTEQAKRTLYVSNISIDSSYLYFKAENYQASTVRILEISAVTTQDNWICTQQERWIESIKRYSTLISMSGGVDRFAFLSRQREYINMLNM